MRDPTASTPAYAVRALGFSYPGQEGCGADRWSLDGVSFDVRQGEVLGLLGPNGSGKTSLLKLLGKLVRPIAGTIALFGSDLAVLREQEVARRVAFVPQEQQHIFPFTVMETVLMGRFPHRPRGIRLGTWETAADVNTARTAMQEMDVEHLADRSIHEVSSGERQRAIIARALTQQPSVLLLDEPTSFLDLHHQVDICRVIRILNEQRGLTVVLVSHDLTLASQYCDRLVLMDRGRVRCIGAPQDVIRPDVLEEVYRCTVLVDGHPESGLPRVTLPARRRVATQNG